jgi:hypothetical protein
VKTAHWVQLAVSAIAAALLPVQQYAIGLPVWVHAIVLALLGAAMALGIPGVGAIINELNPPVAAAPASPVIATPTPAATNATAPVTGS